MAPSTGARPLGITIIAVLALFGGAFGILGSLGLVFGGSIIAAAGGGSVGGFVVISGLVILVLSVAEIALAFGFWTLKVWAWRLGVILALVQVAWSLVGQVLVGIDITGLIITAVISFVWIYYLNKPEIRVAFGAQASGLPVVGNALDPYLAKIKF